MAVNIHITIIELNALHTKRQNLFQELDAVIHLLMEAKHWGLRKSYPNALRDYFRDIGRMVLAAEGRKANDSHADCYQYFCVPEYGTANGRLHFHAVHFMRTLPTGSVDPNFGRRVRNRRQLNSLQNTWPYGYSMPIAVRYTQDAFSRSGWLWPVDAKGEPLKATS